MKEALHERWGVPQALRKREANKVETSRGRANRMARCVGAGRSCRCALLGCTPRRCRQCRDARGRAAVARLRATPPTTLHSPGLPGGGHPRTHHYPAGGSATNQAYNMGSATAGPIREGDGKVGVGGPHNTTHDPSSSAIHATSFLEDAGLTGRAVPPGAQRPTIVMPGAVVVMPHAPYRHPRHPSVIVQAAPVNTSASKAPSQWARPRVHAPPPGLSHLPRTSAPQRPSASWPLLLP